MVELLLVGLVLPHAKFYPTKEECFHRQLGAGGGRSNWHDAVGGSIRRKLHAKSRMSGRLVPFILARGLQTFWQKPSGGFSYPSRNSEPTTVLDVKGRYSSARGSSLGSPARGEMVSLSS